MDVEYLKNLTEEKLSLKEMSEKTGKSPTTIRYWLKKHNLSLFRGPKGKIQDKKQLPHKCTCGETNPEKFYGHKRNICGQCHNKYTVEKGKDKKSRARDLLGGKCQACGFKKFQCSLDIHHLDMTKKDPNFKSMRGWSWERIEKEIKECTLLCKNCHTAVHSGELTGYGAV